MEICGHNIRRNHNGILIDKYVLVDASTLEGDALRNYSLKYPFEAYIFLYKGRHYYDVLNFTIIRELLGFALPWDTDLIMPLREYKVWTDLTDEEIEGMIG